MTLVDTATRPKRGRDALRGPGPFFAGHPALYRLALAGAAATATYAAVRAVRANGAHRVPWLALAATQAAITAGIVTERNAAAHSTRSAAM